MQDNILLFCQSIYNEDIHLCLCTVQLVPQFSLWNQRELSDCRDHLLESHIRKEAIHAHSHVEITVPLFAAVIRHQWEHR